MRHLEVRLEVCSGRAPQEGDQGVACEAGQSPERGSFRMSAGNRHSRHGRIWGEYSLEHQNRHRRQPLSRKHEFLSNSEPLAAVSSQISEPPPPDFVWRSCTSVWRPLQQPRGHSESHLTKRETAPPTTPRAWSSGVVPHLAQGSQSPYAENRRHEDVGLEGSYVGGRLRFRHSCCRSADFDGPEPGDGQTSSGP